MDIDTLSVVFSFLTSKDILLSCSNVCKLFNYATKINISYSNFSTNDKTPHDIIKYCLFVPKLRWRRSILPNILLSNCRELTTNNEKILQLMPNLEVLNFDNSFLYNYDTSSIILPKLRILRIRCNSVTRLLSYILPHSPNLQELAISSGNLMFFDCPFPSSLKKLDLQLVRYSFSFVNLIKKINLEEISFNDQIYSESLLTILTLKRVVVYNIIDPLQTTLSYFYRCISVLPNLQELYLIPHSSITNLQPKELNMFGRPIFPNITHLQIYPFYIKNPKGVFVNLRVIDNTSF